MAAAITRSYHVSMYEIKALACSTLSYEDQQNAYYITFRICNLACSHGNTVLVKVVNELILCLLIYQGICLSYLELWRPTKMLTIFRTCNLACSHGNEVVIRHYVVLCFCTQNCWLALFFMFRTLQFSLQPWKYCACQSGKWLAKWFSSNLFVNGVCVLHCILHDCIVNTHES